ncbi:MAG: hypothetical protein RI902_1890 [Pseudomonadota bacterium]
MITKTHTGQVFMDQSNFPLAINAQDAPPRLTPSNYPLEFRNRVVGRRKQPLGDLFGINNFGVNLTRLSPKAVSALRHAHSRQDEFIFILEGYPTLITDAGATELSPNMCAGFRAGTGDGHQLINMTDQDVVYLEIGDRSAGDTATYPDDDLKALLGVDKKWHFVHKDGSPY